MSEQDQNQNRVHLEQNSFLNSIFDDQYSCNQAKRLKQQQKVENFKQKIQQLRDINEKKAITPGGKLKAQQKQSIQKTLAEKFITLGFGYIINMRAVKKRHNIVIDASYYNNTMSSIVRKTFRSLQKFLLEECKQNSLKKINHYQGSLLRSPMLQCQKWLNKQELDTFYKFICRLYNLKRVNINEDQASRLYGQLIQSTREGHEISYIILHRTKKKRDAKNSQGLTFSYVPSSAVAQNVRNSQQILLTNKFIQN